MPDQLTYRLALYLHSGSVLYTTVDQEEIEDADADDIDELVDDALHQEGKPRWVTLGDVKFHPQAVSAIQLQEFPPTEEAV